MKSMPKAAYNYLEYLSFLYLKASKKKDLFRAYVDQTIAHWQGLWPWKTDAVT